MSRQVTVNIPAASTSKAGAMTAAQVVQLNKATSDIADINGKVGSPNGIVPLGADGLIPSQYTSALARDVLPFHGVISESISMRAMSANMKSSDANAFVLFNSTTKRFVLKVMTGISSNDFKYYSNWLDASTYGTAGDNDGWRANPNKLYVDLVKNNIRRWNEDTEEFNILGSDVQIGSTATDAFSGSEGAALKAKVNEQAQTIASLSSSLKALQDKVATLPTADTSLSAMVASQSAESITITATVTP